MVINSSTDEPTTANIISGGSLYYELHAYGDSNVTVNGGTVSSGGGHAFFAYDKSKVEIIEGIVNDLKLFNSTTATINGGSIRYYLFLYNDAIVHIYDGSIGEVGRDLNASNNAKVYLHGGSLGRHLFVNNYAEVSISGGAISNNISVNDDSQLFISGGFIGGTLFTKFNSHTTVIGTEFNYPLGYIPDTSGTITGTLANGDPLDIPFVREGNGAILLKDPDISLIVTAPNGGERYLTDKPVDIQYTIEGDATIPTVDIEYSPDNGSSWITIATGISNTGTYEWVIPNIESEECLVKVSSADNPTITDISDGTFIIFQCSEVNPADLNSDCYVNLIDFALFAENWLWCGDRYNASCGVE